MATTTKRPVIAIDARLFRNCADEGVHAPKKFLKTCCECGDIKILSAEKDWDSSLSIFGILEKECFEYSGEPSTGSFDTRTLGKGDYNFRMSSDYKYHTPYLTEHGCVSAEIANIAVMASAWEMLEKLVVAGSQSRVALLKCIASYSCDRVAGDIVSEIVGEHEKLEKRVAQIETDMKELIVLGQKFQLVFDSVNGHHD
jgi:hypothetical protein